LCGGTILTAIVPLGEDEIKVKTAGAFGVCHGGTAKELAGGRKQIVTTIAMRSIAFFIKSSPGPVLDGSIQL